MVSAYKYFPLKNDKIDKNLIKPNCYGRSTIPYAFGCLPVRLSELFFFLNFCMPRFEKKSVIIFYVRKVPYVFLN